MSTQTAAWTPSTLASSLPRADRYDVMGPQRVYFYDLDTRAEIESPLSGLHWTGSGPMVSHEGRYVDGTATVVTGAAFIDGVWRQVRVTADSFPGRRVCAKIWYGAEAPSEMKPEWRILAHGDGSAVKGKQPRVGKEWVRAFKAGEVK